MIETAEALQRLRDGNARFVADQRRADSESYLAQRRSLVSEQEPFAAILGCSDSRVPVEIVFDQGLGDLFVVRVAGNVAAEAPVDSIEFAVSQLGTRLVVVLGHTGCGAVNAALEQFENENAGAIVRSIRPALRGLGDADHATRMHKGVRENVRQSVAAVREAPSVKDGGIVVVGAVYDLASGEVEFFDDA